MRPLHSINGRSVMLVVLGLISASATTVGAQDRVDPTAPPAVLRSILENGMTADRPADEQGGDEASETSGDGENGGREPRPGPVMIVRRAADGDWRTRALMNGALVGPGAEIDQGRILAITHNAVRIENAEGARKMRVVEGGVSKHRPGTNETEQE